MRKRILFGWLAFAAVLAAESSAELYQKAVTQERAGKMEDAIKLYEKVAHDFASDRPLAAKALVQAARGYEKLGQDEAAKLYEQVAREYGDQREYAETARVRLAALRQAAQPVTMTQRKIELPYPVVSYLTTDGHREIYRDAVTGALMIANLAGTEKRVIFRPKPGENVEHVMPSRDLSILAIDLNRTKGRVLALIRTDGTGYREVSQAVGWQDWSWDNRYFFITDFQKSPAEFVRISAADGEVRSLGEFDGFHLASPDGHFFAVGADALTRFGKILIMPSEGGEPQLVADNARLLDWTRDGRYLMISAERSGAEALYLLPIKDGKQAGDPIFVRYGSFGFGRTTPEGSFVYQATPAGGGYQAWLGTFDSDVRSVGWERLDLNGSMREPYEPSWSPDSTQIVYTSSNEASGQDTSVIRLRNMASGEERELYRGTPTACIWAQRRPAVLCARDVSEQPDKGQHILGLSSETFAIATDSGRVEPLPLLKGLASLFFASRDDRWIYGWRLILQGPGPELVRLDTTTMEATVVDQISGPMYVPHWLGLEPDEHWAARRVNITTEIRPMSVAGIPTGDWKPLISMSETQMSFTPDGKWVLYHDVDAAGKQNLFRISTSGGQPERIGDFPTESRTGHLRISPDGKKIIAESLVPAEVWVLENFEPKPAAPATKAKP